MHVISGMGMGMGAPTKSIPKPKKPVKSFNWVKMDQVSTACIFHHSVCVIGSCQVASVLLVTVVLSSALLDLDSILLIYLCASSRPTKHCGRSWMRHGLVWAVLDFADNMSNLCWQMMGISYNLCKALQFTALSIFRPVSEFDAFIKALSAQHSSHWVMHHHPRFSGLRTMQVMFTLPRSRPDVYGEELLPRLFVIRSIKRSYNSALELPSFLLKVFLSTCMNSLTSKKNLDVQQ